MATSTQTTINTNNGVFMDTIVTASRSAIHHAIAISTASIGPLMSISSILWFMMRNDPAIEPKSSWIVFGAWSLLMLLYFTAQYQRVSYKPLYVLSTIAVSSLCMCMVALVQQSTLQGGLVTAIPPCTSFAAYAVAYVFPERRVVEGWLSAV